MTERVNKGKMMGVLIMIIMAVTFLAFMSAEDTHAAAKTKVYNQVLVDGEHAYCIAGTGMFDVNTSTGQINQIVENPGPYGHYRQMTKKDDYLYYVRGGTDVRGEFFRVKTTGEDSRQLAGFLNKSRFLTKYMIKKGKIYYTEINGKNKTEHKVMKLDGKSKKKTRTAAKWKQLDSSTDGYKIVSEFKEMPSGSDYATSAKYWLQVPDGTQYYLGETYFYW